MVRTIIRRSAGETRSLITMKDVILDVSARRVERAGTEVELTAREYALFEYLAINRGKVITRKQLYDHLFDEQEGSLSNLLDVHVSNLRKKLGHELIVTRRGTVTALNKHEASNNHPLEAAGLVRSFDRSTCGGLDRCDVSFRKGAPVSKRDRGVCRGGYGRLTQGGTGSTSSACFGATVGIDR